VKQNKALNKKDHQAKKVLVREYPKSGGRGGEGEGEGGMVREA
jgi:hypothetical protein